MENIFISNFIPIAATAIITYFITIYHTNKKTAQFLLTEGKSLNIRLEREFEKGKEAGRIEAHKTSTPNDIVELKLESEFQKGKDAGRSEELSNFTLTYEPFAESIEEYMGLKKRSTLGYHMQIYYSGFPIGHQTRYITHTNIEYDEKRIEKLLNSEVASAINGIIQMANTKGMKTEKLPPKRGKTKP